MYNCLYHKRNKSELNNKSLPKMDCTGEFSDTFKRDSRLYIDFLINSLKLYTLCETNILLVALQLYANPMILRKTLLYITFILFRKAV